MSTERRGNGQDRWRSRWPAAGLGRAKMARVAFIALVLVGAGAAGCSREQSGVDGSSTTSTTAPSGQTGSSGSTAPAGSTTTVSTVSRSGSTTASTAVAPQAGLPQPVAAMREAIVSAALAGEYDRLEQLALKGDSVFSFGTGDPAEGDRPGGYWRRQEEKGTSLLAGLVGVLELPYVSREELEAGVYVWPDVSGLDWRHLTDEQRTRLRRSFPAADVAAWEKAGAYLGYRVGIGRDGDWLFFTEGE